MMQIDERIDQLTIEINNIKEDILKDMDLEILNQCRMYLIEKNIRLSMAHIVFKNLLTIDNYLKQMYQTKEDMIGSYIEFDQSKWDSLFVICVKANYLGIDPYPSINISNDLNYLTNEQKTELLQVNEEATNKYFEYFMEYNIETTKGYVNFVNKMTKFGENHDLTDAEIDDFINIALEHNINVAHVDSQEELDKVYELLYPKA